MKILTTTVNRESIMKILHEGHVNNQNVCILYKDSGSLIIATEGYIEELFKQKANAYFAEFSSYDLSRMQTSQEHSIIGNPDLRPF